MSDRELLELAAKAAGIADLQQVGNIWYYTNGGYLMREWNPLTDDGDALRLAVKLSINVFYRENINGVFVIADREGIKFCPELLSNDPYAATRRAIVRAAAEIGKEMK